MHRLSSRATLFCPIITIVGCVFGLSQASAQSVFPANGKLKVFLLVGQSNMQGHGVIKADPRRNEGRGTLEYIVKTKSDRYGHLMDRDGNWAKRSDVWIWYFDRYGKLTAGYGANEKLIGPELQFGHVVGDAFDDQVLIIKTAWGGKSVAVDFRSPSSGKIGPEFSDKFRQQLKSNPDQVGHYYREVLRNVKQVLDNPAKFFPAYDGNGYELVGIGWHQGWNDRVNQAFNDHYRDNLANLIRDIRKDLKWAHPFRQPIPFVIAETGMSGFEEKHPRALSLMKAQKEVSELKEFQGNVGFVETKPFFRKKENSPSGQAFHWNQNAETHLLIGEGLAKSMLDLLQ